MAGSEHKPSEVVISLEKRDEVGRQASKQTGRRKDWVSVLGFG